MDVVRRRIDERSVRVGVVGFGYIGSCIGTVLAIRGLTVVGVDTDAGRVEEINAGTTSVREAGLADLVNRAHAAGRLTASTDYGVLKETDVIVVTVGTPLGDGLTPNLNFIQEAANSIMPHLRRGHVVILKSTVPPGATNGTVRPALERSGLIAGRDFGLVFSPERLAEGNAIAELQRLPIVVGGVDPRSTEIAATFWETILGVETSRVSSPGAAEFTKLASNLWIDLNIALANELAKLCDKLDIDGMEVIRAANTLPKGQNKVNILFPSVGVGGPCLTKDPWFLYALGKDLEIALQIPEVSRRVNDSMPAYAVSAVERALGNTGRIISGAKIAVLGLSFKTNTGDVRSTPVKEFVDLALSKGANVRLFDPLVAEQTTVDIFGRGQVASLDDAIAEADVIAVLTWHYEFRGISFADLRSRVSMPCLILDGRNEFLPEKIAEAREQGFVYFGIGRGEAR